MRVEINAVLDYSMLQPVDVLLTIEIAQLPDQILVEDKLIIDGVGPLRAIDGEDRIGRRTWMRAQGKFLARYRAIVDVERQSAPIESLQIAPRKDLPAEVIPYLWPSRYCEADQFETFVAREFPGENCGTRILAMADWIHGHLDYVSGSSDGTTTAVDTFVRRQGVCRDYAHLLAAFCRAAGVPARLVSAYAAQLDPPDFHAVVEVWLQDGWHLIDATKLAPVDRLVRIAVGRDATDIAFMTVFGTATLNMQSVDVQVVDAVSVDDS